MQLEDFKEARPFVRTLIAVLLSGPFVWCGLPPYNIIDSQGVPMTPVEASYKLADEYLSTLEKDLQD